MKIRKLFLLNMPFCFFLGCASSEKAIIPTMEDLDRAETTAREALRLSIEDSVLIASVVQHIDFISKRMDLLDSLSAILPLAAATENQLQIALLREEVSFMRRFLENQNIVPLVNPNRKLVPEAPGPFPPEYDQAKYSFTQKNYELAAKQFEKVTVLYPKSLWAPDAWYWAGESQMALGNYALGISSFEKVFFYPESIKAADAQFQIGICLSRMGEKEHAKAAFRKVQEFYPKSPRALQAQTELNKLK